MNFRLFLKLMSQGGDDGGTPPIINEPDGGTPAPTPAQEPNEPPTLTPGETEKTLTQAQVNEIVQSRLKEQKDSLLKKLGFETEEKIIEELGKAKTYDEMKNSSDAIASELASLKESNLLNKLQIDPNRVDDVKTFFKGKEKELTEEHLIAELEKHPEWVNKNIAVPRIGGTPPPGNQPTEREKVFKLFGF